MAIITNIWNTVKGLVQFVTHGVESFLTLLQQIPKFLSFLGEIITNIPVMYQGFILASIGVTLVYMIVGRSK